MALVVVREDLVGLLELREPARRRNFGNWRNWQKMVKIGSFSAVSARIFAIQLNMHCPTFFEIYKII